LHDAGISVHLLAGTRDIWCRDYMPVQLGKAEFLKFRYAPDYLRHHPSLVTEAISLRHSLSRAGRVRVSAIKLDGGNVVASHDKVILTDKVFRENRSYSKEQFTLKLERLFLARCMFIPVEPGDNIGHADGVVRFVDEQTVVVNDYRKIDPDYGERLRAALRGTGLRVEELAYSCSDEKVNGIFSAVGNYVNCLRVAGLAVVPAYGMPEDKVAVRRLRELLPGTKIVALRCDGLAREGAA
jgi:agmatine/peptidylarginine deiminase